MEVEGGETVEEWVNNKNYDFIAGKGVDKTTYLVMSKGEDYHPLKKQIVRRWDACPQRLKLKTIPQKIQHNQWKQHKFGKLTVIAKSRFKNSADKRLWIVKCECGIYETRTLKAISNPDNWGDRCGYCNEIAESKRSKDYRQGIPQKDSREY